MQLMVNKLHSHYSQVFLTYVILNTRSKVEDVVETLEGLKGNKRILDIKLLVNGIEYDAQIIEDTIKKLWDEFTKEEIKKYSDLESLAQKKAEEMFRKRLEDLKEPSLEKIRFIQEKLEDISLTLDCIL